MPDTMITTQQAAASVADAARPLSLLGTYERAARAYREADAETVKAFEEAQGAIARLRTVDPVGLALRLKLCKETVDFSILDEVVADLLALAPAPNGRPVAFDERCWSN